MTSKMIRSIGIRRQLLQRRYVSEYGQSKFEPVREQDYLKIVEVINPYFISPVNVYYQFHGKDQFFSLTLQLDYQSIIKKCGVYISTADADVISYDTAPLIVNQYFSSENNALFTISNNIRTDSQGLQYGMRTNALAILSELTGEFCIAAFQPKTEYTNINILLDLFKEYNEQNFSNYQNCFINPKRANILAITPKVSLQGGSAIIANFSKPIAPVNLSKFSYNNKIYNNESSMEQDLTKLINENTQPTDYNSNELKLNNKAPLFISLMGYVSKVGETDIGNYLDITSYIKNISSSKDIGILNGKWKIGIKRMPKLVSTDNKLPLDNNYTQYMCNIIYNQYIQLHNCMIYFKYFYIFNISASVTIKKKLTYSKNIEIYLNTDKTTLIFATTIQPNDPRNNVGQVISINVGMEGIYNNQWFSSSINPTNFIGGFASLSSNTEGDDNFNTIQFHTMIVVINNQ